MERTVALVVAAGRGTRFGGELPKQYCDLAGRPVLRHAAESLRRHPAVDAVRVVIHPDDADLYGAATAGLDLLPPVAGGASRRQSVLNGLESLVDLAPERVLVHDGARPLVDGAMVDRVLAALDGYAGAIPAVPVADTLKRAAADRSIAATVPRDGLWRAQTPQAFRFAALLAAHRAASGVATEPTDDAQVLEEIGEKVALVMGSEDNIKITRDGDIARALHALMPAGETRVGTGFDVHAFGDGDHVWLGGVRIPHDHGLVGHSDADVALHALTDAILGAIGAADIGAHFPPSDPQWRGASSDRFLAHAGGLVAERGGAVVHVDLTIVCERPRVGPHREAIIARVADILGLPASRVSVKATTTEGLGFTGRREGIAAQAVATVRLP
ncbi:MAG: bifunctional 2-C-methyl-D-erythritol 4-phosphate cytidylyltransferase/2-C-methyl-D-erythritol 2,4-cyclodiphosphate synthase [Alphaproteobacteria bacterium]